MMNKITLSVFILSFSVTSAFSKTCICKSNDIILKDAKISTIDVRNTKTKKITIDDSQTCEETREAYNAQNYHALKACAEINQEAWDKGKAYSVSYEDGMFIENFGRPYTNCITDGAIAFLNSCSVKVKNSNHPRGRRSTSGTSFRR